MMLNLCLKRSKFWPNQFSQEIWSLFPPQPPNVHKHFITSKLYAIKLNCLHCFELTCAQIWRWICWRCQYQCDGLGCSHETATGRLEARCRLRCAGRVRLSVGLHGKCFCSSPLWGSWCGLLPWSCLCCWLRETPLELFVERCCF